MQESGKERKAGLGEREGGRRERKNGGSVRITGSPKKNLVHCHEGCAV